MEENFLQLPDECLDRIVGYMAYNENFLTQLKRIYIFESEEEFKLFFKQTEIKNGVFPKKIDFGNLIFFLEKNFLIFMEAQTKINIENMLITYGLSHVMHSVKIYDDFFKKDFYKLSPGIGNEALNYEHKIVNKINISPGKYYKNCFDEALERTNRLGLDIVKFPFRIGSSSHEIKNLINNRLISNKKEDFIMKCNIISQLGCEVINKYTSHKAVLTIGTIIKDTTDMFSTLNSFNEDFILETMRGGEDSLRFKTYSHHSWITLDTMEILDFTFGASIDSSKDSFPIVFTHPNDLKGGVFYKPVLIGSAFYLKYDLTKLNNVKSLMGDIFLM